MAKAGVPFMRVVVVTPEHLLGDVVGDFEARRGSIKKIATVGELQGILAWVPMAELLQYPAELDHLTEGQARYQISFSHYETGDNGPDGARVRSHLPPRPPTRSSQVAARLPDDAEDPLE